MFQKMKKSKGFTLIEMLVVIAIIAVLVAIIVPVVGNSTTKAKAAADAANLRSIASTVAVDYLDDSEIDNPPSAPACKSLSGTVTLNVYDVNGNVEAYYVADGAYYDVDAFAASAASGNAPSGANAAPSSGKLMVSGTCGGTTTAQTGYTVATN